MQQPDWVADGTSYNATMSACEKRERWQQALGLLAALQKVVLVAETQTKIS